MSRAIASFPENMRDTVVMRRMRNYTSTGSNGIGTLAAKDAFDKASAKASKKIAKKAEAK